MPDKNVEDLAESIRQIRSEIRDLKGQFGISQMSNKTIYQAVANETFQEPTIVEPTTTGGTVTGGTLTGSLLTDAQLDGNAQFIDNPTFDVDFDLGAKNFVNTGYVKTPTVTVANPDAGVDQTLVASGGAGDETITALNNLTVVNGIFGATTITVGDQVISEDGNLIVSDPVSPGIKIQDTGHTYPNTAMGFHMADDEGTSVFQIDQSEGWTRVLVAGANNFLWFQTNANQPIKFDINATVQLLVTDGTFEPETDNDIDLGTAAKEFKDLFLDGTAHIDTLDVDVNATITGTLGITGQCNFAGGTTYKVEADGDATFKFLNLSALEIISNQINEVVTDGNAGGILINFDGYLSGTTRFRDFGVYDGKRSQLMYFDGSAGKVITFCGFNVDVSFSSARSIIMNSVTTADARIQLPYLTQIPTSVANGSIWMEADGLHIYYNGAEKLVAGV